MKKIIATGSAVIFGACLLAVGYLLNDLGTGSYWNEVSFFFKIALTVGIISGAVTYYFRKDIDSRFLIFWP